MDSSWRNFFLLVTFAYEQALLSMGFHPDIWYEAALFLESHSKQMMERGVSFTCLLCSSDFNIFFISSNLQAMTWPFYSYSAASHPLGALTVHLHSSLTALA